MPEQIKTLEQGSIFFFYRPKVGEKHPSSESDIQRFYMILKPDQKDTFRLTIIGKKELPESSESGHRRYWGYTASVSDKPEQIRELLGPEHYDTKTRGERFSETARPAGEGIYRIVKHNGHTHLLYVLELPKKTGEVQDELNIEEQASYIITVKNPEKGSPGAGLQKNRNAYYPESLQQKFGNKRFSELDPVDFLDYERAEFILIASSDDIKEELGIELKAEDESLTSANIFSDLKLDKSKRPIKPLLEGEWK